MTETMLLFLVIGCAVGGFINGLAGFETALFALGFFLNIMSPIQAVAIVVLLSVISGLQGAWLVRHTMFKNPWRLLRYLLPALIGVPLGVILLSYINASALKIIVAGFLIFYGGYFMIKNNLPEIDKKTPFLDCAVGFSGGVLGGMASLSGALPTMWASTRTWSKTETRAVLQPFNIIILFVTAGVLAWRGAYNIQTSCVRHF